MTSIMLPLRRSDSNLPTTSAAINHEMYETTAPCNYQTHQTYREHREHNSNKNYHHHHHHRRHRRDRHHLPQNQRPEFDNISMPAPDEDDLFVSNATIASNLLTSLKQPSKMTFNWSRQFNETLATISGLLQRNFQENPYPGCNVSEASASTATLGSSTAIDAAAINAPKPSTSNSVAKAPYEKRQKHRQRNSSIGDPRELDMLVLEKVNDDDSDSY